MNLRNNEIVYLLIKYSEIFKWVSGGDINFIKIENVERSNLKTLFSFYISSVESVINALLSERSGIPFELFINETRNLIATRRNFHKEPILENADLFLTSVLHIQKIVNDNEDFLDIKIENADFEESVKREDNQNRAIFSLEQDIEDLYAIEDENQEEHEVIKNRLDDISEDLFRVKKTFEKNNAERLEQIDILEDKIKKLDSTIRNFLKVLTVKISN